MRSDARMLHFDRTTGRIAHRQVRDLPSILRTDDLLVFNDTKVIPARFTLRKPTGGLIEALWLAGEDKRWQVLLKNLGPVDPDATLAFVADPGVTLRVVAKREHDGYDAECSHDASVLDRVGRMPLPPYIKRAKGSDGRDEADRERYQTVVADVGRSVAAPTAALHFDPPLLAALSEAGVPRTSVNLEVGMGTFKPVTAEDLDAHDMHSERWRIEPTAADAINVCRGRIIAIGTTSCRTLESQPTGDIRPGSGETDLLIQPPYTPRHVDALLTNFHLPKSTLIALVDGFIGTEARRRVYVEAIEQRYRFFSYGDCMLIE